MELGLVPPEAVMYASGQTQWACTVLPFIVDITSLAVCVPDCRCSGDLARLLLQARDPAACSTRHGHSHSPRSFPFASSEMPCLSERLQLSLLAGVKACESSQSGRSNAKALLMSLGSRGSRGSSSDVSCSRAYAQPTVAESIPDLEELFWPH